MALCQHWASIAPDGELAFGALTMFGESGGEVLGCSGGVARGVGFTQPTARWCGQAGVGEWRLAAGLWVG